MDKYVIRNCPCFFEENEEVNDYTCTWNGTEELACQDCTDCVLKCIKSKLDYLKCYINNDDSANLSKMNEIIDNTLKLLDIQEA